MSPLKKQRRIVVMGASAGGVEALQQTVAGLPADLQAPLCVVLHLPPHVESALPQILSRAGPIPAQLAEDGEALEAGRIYVAPTDQHLLIESDRMRLVDGPRENGHRPAIDPLFRSAALTHGNHVVAVILSGTRDDGVAGLRAVSEVGGVGIVQDPQEAAHGDMPRQAIRGDAPNHVLPPQEIGPTIARLVQEGQAPMDETRPSGAAPSST